MAPAKQGIAMWGPPTSGKTTFLAALSLALSRRNYGWNVASANESSEKVLINLTTALSSRQSFPERTAAIEEYSWVLNGQRTELTGKGFRKNVVTRRVTVGIELVDASGEFTGPDHVGFTVRDELIQKIAESRGILYMFDPTREFDDGDAFDHTFGMVVQLARQMADNPEFDGRLPHYVAVCVTKFDDRRVYMTANQMRLLTVDEEDPYRLPRVNDDDARHLFRRLCQVSGTGNAEMIINVFEQYFHPERVRYFVTSAIGFYVDPRTGRFDQDDTQNLLEDGKNPKKPLIRGPVYPINVVEPVLWLCSSFAQQNGTGPGT
jgi:hypothetical protein